MNVQPIANGTWVICEVEGHRFTAQVKAHLYKDEVFVYQVEAELLSGRPVLQVEASQIVDIF